MTEDELVKVLQEQGRLSTHRLHQIRKMIIGSFSFLAIMTLIFGLIIYDQSNTISSLSETISRKNPVLDYLKCHDDLEDKRNLEQTNYLLTLIDGGSNPSPEVVFKQNEARLKYEKAEINLQQLAQCPKI
jgi:hypothetical protein